MSSLSSSLLSIWRWIGASKKDCCMHGLLSLRAAPMASLLHSMLGGLQNTMHFSDLRSLKQDHLVFSIYFNGLGPLQSPASDLWLSIQAWICDRTLRKWLKVQWKTHICELSDVNDPLLLIGIPHGICFLSPWRFWKSGHATFATLQCVGHASTRVPGTANTKGLIVKWGLSNHRHNWNRWKKEIKLTWHEQNKLGIDQASAKANTQSRGCYSTTWYHERLAECASPKHHVTQSVEPGLLVLGSLSLASIIFNKRLFPSPYPEFPTVELAARELLFNLVNAL